MYIPYRWLRIDSPFVIIILNSTDKRKSVNNKSFYETKLLNFNNIIPIFIVLVLGGAWESPAFQKASKKNRDIEKIIAR